ncbi:MAG: thiamine pyrophosphate-binding protein [Chloroflexi bacterium]|nr:thiamine pyrophosphate-binding protein [Chloroflexota bacterium]
MDCFEAQKVIAQHRGNGIVVYVGSCIREWPRISSTEMDLQCHGAMGKGSSFGLGLALALPARKVIVLDADGGLLMNLGSLATIANMAPPNLVHFVFNNGVWRGSGGQPIPGAGKTSFKGLAEAAGYPHAYEFEQLDDLQSSIGGILNQVGPIFVCLKTPPLTESPPFPFLSGAESVIRYTQFRKAMERSFS